MLYIQKDLNININKDLCDKTKTAILELKQELNSVKDYEFINMVFRDDDLKEIEEISKFLRDNFKKILILGIGGSTLGAKTLLSLKEQDKVIILENIDDNSVKKVFNQLDLKTTGILVISKSGKTVESASQTLILMKMIEDKLGKSEIGKHFFFLTENKDNSLTQLSKEFGIKIIPHNPNIGGRFSYLSNVGLIPVCIAGLDIKKIREGAKETVNYLFNDENNFISDIVTKQNFLYHNGIAGNVMMTYCERLSCLGDWYRQLWAESLGKNGFGTLPIPALGTLDQHSQLQLYLAGPKNLFFTFFVKEPNENSLRITKTYNNNFDYLQNMSLDEIMKVEYESTIEILNKKKLPIRLIKFKEVDEKFISQLMMQFMFETILIGKLNNITVFGQPDVEEKKIISKEMYNNRQ